MEFTAEALQEGRIILLQRSHQKLYSFLDSPDELLTDYVLKSINISDNSVSAIRERMGEVHKPIDMIRLLNTRGINEHHSTCLRAKEHCTTGLGLVNESMEEVLDGLCEVSFQDVISDVTQDFEMTGNGYMEVVRNESGAIKALYHQKAPAVTVVVDDEQNGYHFLIKGTGLPFAETTKAIRMARFGDTERFKTVIMPKYGIKEPNFSELIHIRQPSPISIWYGMPDWLAGIVSIEIIRKCDEQTFDAFNNRCVPEFFLFLIGGAVDPKSFNALEAALNRTIGSGNTRKSALVHLPDTNVKVQLEKLAAEGRTDTVGFPETSVAAALRIVTAHGVPPLIAGIQVPGKLGATNELPSAMVCFQLLTIDPKQRIFQTVLNNTLGRSNIRGVTRRSFKFKKITDEADLQALTTVGGMREPVQQATAEGRNLGNGFKS